MKLKRYKTNKNKINLFDEIFYLENRTEKCEELEDTEGLKLGYVVTAGKKLKSHDKHTIDR